MIFQCVFFYLSQLLDSFYGNWFDMVTGYWKEYKDSPNVYFVVYEELVKVGKNLIIKIN